MSPLGTTQVHTAEQVSLTEERKLHANTWLQVSHPQAEEENSI